jgi:hypothetical protein
MAIDHTNCTHPRTPAGRRACRAGNLVPSLSQSISPERSSAEQRDRDERSARIRASFASGPEIKITGPVARRMARQAIAADNARIQPRRSGARVSTRNTSCVQAALHIDAHGGRCACGWEAAV